MNQYKDSSINYFLGKGSRKARAKQIRKIDPRFYVAADGSIYEISNYGLFQRYEKIAEADNEPEYETCKECGKVHNEIANRTYDDYNTPFSPFANKEKVKAAPPESDKETKEK